MFVRVNVDNNVRDKAKGVQDIYLNRGKSVISLTFTGSGIQVRLPPGLVSTTENKISLKDDELEIDHNTKEVREVLKPPKGNWVFSLTSNEWQKWRNPLIGEVIESLDALFGLSVPIFIFGYTKLGRSISFRSNRR